MSAPLYAGHWLARRITQGEACLAARFAAAPGDVERIAGGCAVFAGESSPLTHACGMGLAGPVGDVEIEHMEQFFFSRGAHSAVEVTPFTDASLIDALQRREYRIAEFENVLVRRAEPAPPSPEKAGPVEVRPCGPGERELWAQLTARGFFSRDEIGLEEIAVGSAIFHSSQCFFAFAGGAVVGGAALVIHQGLAFCFADSTLAAARGRGAQAALIRARLREAAGRGCDFVTATTVPGSQSQRNYERLGFQVAYTKFGMWREPFT